MKTNNEHQTAQSRNVISKIYTAITAITNKLFPVESERSIVNQPTKVYVDGSNCTDEEKLYELYKRIYLNSPGSTIRSRANHLNISKYRSEKFTRRIGNELSKKRKKIKI